MGTTPAFTAGALCLPGKLSEFARSGGTGGVTEGHNGFEPDTTASAVIAVNDSIITRPIVLRFNEPTNIMARMVRQIPPRLHMLDSDQCPAFEGWQR